MKKTLNLFMAFVLLLTASLSGVQGVSANNSQTKNDGFSEKELQEANIIEKHLVLESDTNKLIITNEKELEKSLEKISAETSLEDLKKDIDNVNSVKKENEGNIQPLGVCSAAMTAMGLYQGMTIDAAMLALGIASTPALLAVTAGIGVMWAGGSLMCP